MSKSTKVKRFKKGTFQIGQPFNPFNKMLGCHLPNALLECAGLRPIGKLVWGRLAQYTGNNGDCYPNQDTLANELGVSITTIKRAIYELQRNKFIGTARIRKSHKPKDQKNHYFLLFHPCFEEGFKEEEDVSTVRRDNDQEHVSKWIHDKPNKYQKEGRTRIKNDHEYVPALIQKENHINRIREENHIVSEGGQDGAFGATPSGLEIPSKEKPEKEDSNSQIFWEETDIDSISQPKAVSGQDTIQHSSIKSKPPKCFGGYNPDERSCAFRSEGDKIGKPDRWCFKCREYRMEAERLEEELFSSELSQD